MPVKKLLISLFALLIVFIGIFFINSLYLQKIPKTSISDVGEELNSDLDKCNSNDVVENRKEWLFYLYKLMAQFENGEVVLEDITGQKYFDEVARIMGGGTNDASVDVFIIASKISNIDKKTFDHNRVYTSSCNLESSFFVNFEDIDFNNVVDCSNELDENMKTSFINCIDQKSYVAYKICKDTNDSVVISDCIFAHSIDEK
jgi:hypothetical protein